MTCRRSAREMEPRNATCTCGASRFCGSIVGEILHVVANTAAQVLDQPVEQRREVDRIPRSPLIVVTGRVDRRAVLADLAVAVTREGEEHRRPVGLAVRRGEYAPGRLGRDLPARKPRRCPDADVWSALGAAVWRAAVAVACTGPASQAAADTASGQLGVQFGDDVVELGGVLAVRGGFVAHGLCSGTGGKPELLRLIRARRDRVRLGVEVPAIAALLSPQRPGALGARLAHGVDRGAAGDRA